jgi:hypothetical protein
MYSLILTGPPQQRRPLVPEARILSRSKVATFTGGRSYGRHSFHGVYGLAPSPYHRG